MMSATVSTEFLTAIQNWENGKTDVIAYDYNEDGEWDKFENV